jgi:hypothetical protein
VEEVVCGGLGVDLSALVGVKGFDVAEGEGEGVDERRFGVEGRFEVGDRGEELNGFVVEAVVLLLDFLDALLVLLVFLGELLQSVFQFPHSLHCFQVGYFKLLNCCFLMLLKFLQILKFGLN